MEVQLSKEMIEQIHSMTKRKRILVEDKEARLGYGWKQPHKRSFYMWKKVKLISHSWGHKDGLHKIGERLYSERDWHGRERSMTVHKPYITLEELRTVQRVTKIPKQELEASIVSARNRHSLLEVSMKFPVKANEDWAWLFGYYFASGSLTTRDRVGKDGYPSEEREVRFRVEQRVYEKKLVPILQRVGYVPKMTPIWYEKYGGHKLDKQRRKGTGNKPRKLLVLPRVIREVMEHFGLYTDYARQAPIGVQSAGRLLDWRKIKANFPSWIMQTRILKHAFIEGFMNGGQTSSQFRAEDKGIVRMVELRVGTVTQQETEKLIDFFRQELKTYGITGTVHRLKHREPEKVYWLGYQIYSHEALARLFESFDIQQPVVRVRLNLAYFMNSLLYELCKRTPLDVTDTLILGALMENPQNEEALSNELRLRPDQVTTALNKLTSLDVVEKEDGTWRILPTGCREHVIKALQLEDEKRQAFLAANGSKFFSKCNKCGNIIPHDYKGRCGCGGMFEPLERKHVLKSFSYSNRGRIARVRAEELPNLSEIK
jgi:hypothetical protein